MARLDRSFLYFIFYFNAMGFKKFLMPTERGVKPFFMFLLLWIVTVHFFINSVIIPIEEVHLDIKKLIPTHEPPAYLTYLKFGFPLFLLLAFYIIAMYGARRAEE
jgi:hypothetical protein